MLINQTLGFSIPSPKKAIQTIVVIRFLGMNANSLVLQTHQSVHAGETKSLHCYLFNQQNHIFAFVLLLLPVVTFETVEARGGV